MVLDPDEAYFAEFDLGITNAWKVSLDNWQLYRGLAPAVPAGPVPSDPFLAAITIAAAEGHNVLQGSVFVNDEEIEFNGATRLTSTTALDSLPEITTEGLDCQILVECVTTGRAPIKKEALTPIEIIVFPKTRILRNPTGSGHMQTDYDIYSKAILSIGDQIRYPDPHQGQTIDVYVKLNSSAVDLELDNTQPFRLYNCA